MASDGFTAEPRRGDMVRVLCWYPGDGEYDEYSGDLFYAGGWQTGAGTLEYEYVIGICRTPKGVRPDSAGTREAFRENVEAVATDVRWFPEVL